MDIHAKQPACIKDFIKSVNDAGVKMAAQLAQHERALSNLTRAREASNLEYGCKDDQVDMTIDVFLEKFGYSEAEFARSLDVLPQVVQNWKKAVQPVIVRVGLKQYTVEVIRTEARIKSCILQDIGEGV